MRFLKHIIRCTRECLFFWGEINKTTYFVGRHRLSMGSVSHRARHQTRHVRAAEWSKTATNRVVSPGYGGNSQTTTTTDAWQRGVFRKMACSMNSVRGTVDNDNDRGANGTILTTTTTTITTAVTRKRRRQQQQQRRRHQ